MITERTRVPARYRLLEEVGQGGMAVVYRARDESLKREVAVKVLHQHLWSEPESKARLEREAQAVAKLKHDNILEIFDYSGSNADSAYIVTEFIDGQTLKQFVASRTIRHPEVAALIGTELAGALVHAHGMGIIHRDVKPENVMIRKDGVLKLMDFGIAQVLDMERMTVTGQLLGSPAYMAPELIEGRPLDVRTDVFSVGILLYQLATGVLPFTGKNPHEVLRRISEGRFADPRSLNPRCGGGMCRILARALAHDPADRYPTMKALADDLTEDLKEAGLTDVRGELRRYFHDPVDYENKLPALLTPALTSAAEAHLAAGSSPRAMECWNRVLAYEPNNGAVLSALNRLQGRHRVKVAARWVALGALALVVAAGSVAALVRTLSSREGKSTAGVAGVNTAAPRTDVPRVAISLPAAPPEARVGTGEGSGRQITRGPVAHPLRPRPAGGPERPPPAGRLAHQPAEDVTNEAHQPKAAASSASDTLVRTFTLGPTPQNVDVYLDGERQFSYDTDHRTLPVPWNGNHVVEFRSPSGCCFVERIEVGPDRPLPPDNIIARQLKWKPARLVVTTLPATPAGKVRVMVRDPGHAGRGTVVEPGEEANIPFFADDEGQKEIDVSIDAPGAFAAERITVRAGERKAVVLTLGAAP